MLPLAIMPKTLVFTALVLLHASLHARSGWGGGGGWGGRGSGCDDVLCGDACMVMFAG